MKSKIISLAIFLVEVFRMSQSGLLFPPGYSYIRYSMIEVCVIGTLLIWFSDFLGEHFSDSINSIGPILGKLMGWFMLILVGAFLFLYS